DCRPVMFVVRMHLEPHGVEDAETACETDTEQPREVPHVETSRPNRIVQYFPAFPESTGQNFKPSGPRRTSRVSKAAPATNRAAIPVHAMAPMITSGRLAYFSVTGNTPSMTHGPRPASLTIQPSAPAIHGTGKLHAAMRRNQRLSSLRFDASQNAQPNSTMAYMPSNAMPRNVQNNSVTFGTVSRAAAAIIASLACAGCEVYRSSSKP